MFMHHRYHGGTGTGEPWYISVAAISCFILALALFAWLFLTMLHLDY